MIPWDLVTFWLSGAEFGLELIVEQTALAGLRIKRNYDGRPRRNLDGSVMMTSRLGCFRDQVGKLARADRRKDVMLMWRSLIIAAAIVRGCATPQGGAR